MEIWTAFQHLLFWIGVGLLWWVWIEYKKFTIDKTRQRLFVIRDELFMKAANAEVSFDSEAYKLTRNLLNGAIRYTERLTLSRVVRVNAILDHYEIQNRFSHSFAAAIKGLDDSQKKVFTTALKETDQVLIRHLVHSNFLILTVAELASVLHLTNQLMKRLASKIKSAKKVINNDIYIDLVSLTA